MGWAMEGANSRGKQGQHKGYRMYSFSGVSTLGARGALPHQIQMALLGRKLNTSVLCGKIYFILFHMQSSVNVCKLDSQAL